MLQENLSDPVSICFRRVIFNSNLVSCPPFLLDSSFNLQGVLDGATGLVKKPIEGAREDGAKGLFKGMGVGLVGVVTRPVSGALDAVHEAMSGIHESV